MSKTPFSSLCKVLGELWLYGRNSLDGQEWEEFFEDNAESLVLAYLIDLGAVSINGNTSGNLAKAELEGAWEDFCFLINIPNGLTYRNLEEAFLSRVFSDE